MSERAGKIGLSAAILVGIAARLYVAQALDGRAFNDTAIVGLMALHELAGRFYAFYWGQSYMGSIESLSIAPFFALFGVNEFTLSIGLLPWFVIFTLAIYLLTDLCAGKRAALIAAILSAVAPAFLQYHEMMPLGGYPETLALGTILVLLTLRLVYRPMATRVQDLHLIATGAVAGLAFWTNWLVLPYFIVCGVYLILWDPRLLRRRASGLAALAFLAGSAPFWVYNLQNHFATFHLLEREAAVVEPAGRSADLYWVMTRGLPNVLGVREIAGEFVEGAAGRLFAALLVGALATALYATRRSSLALARGRVAEASPVTSLFLFTLVTAIVYTECRPTTLRLERYLTPFATATIPLCAIAIDRLLERRRAAGVAVLAFALALDAREIVDLHQHFVKASARDFAGPVEGLARHLLASPVRFAYADYGDAMITTFLTRDRVVVTDYQNRRYPIDEEKIEDPAVILHDDPQATAATTLESLDAEFAVQSIPGYQVYWPIRYDGVARAPLARGGWTVAATASPEDAELVLDDDPETAWTPPATASHPALTLDLGRVETVSGIYLALGGRPKNAFHELVVEASADGERWELVKEARWDFPINFRSDGQVSVLPDDVQAVLFPPRAARRLRLTLRSAFAGETWAIAELSVFGPVAGGPVYQTPAFADPSALPVAERRFLREAERHPESDAPVRALRDLYLRHGDGAAVARVERVERERFSPATRLDWSFGGDLELVGYDRRSLGERDVEITYYWRAERRLRGDYAASLRIVGGSRHFEQDFVLGDALHRTGSWGPGETYKQTERVSVPPDLPAGDYDVQIGLWNPSTRRHLPLGPWWRPAKTGDLLHIGVAADARRASLPSRP